MHPFTKMSKTVYDQNCCFFEFAILPSFFRLSWQKIWDGFLESWNPSVSKTLQYSMSKSKLAKFYLLAMLKSGILFSKSNILCKYPLQSWCPFLMNTKWQVEKNTNSMHTHRKKNILKGHISKLQQIKRLLVLLHLYFVGFYCLFGSMRGHFCMNSQNGILMNLIFLDAHLHVGFDEIWFHQTHVSCSSLSWLRRVILDLTSF